jgi:hypothetical protein
MTALAEADQNRDLRSLGKLLLSDTTLPDWARSAMGELFLECRLQPRRIDLRRGNKTTRDLFKRLAAIQIHHLHRNAERLPGETSKERLKRIIHEYVERNFKLLKRHDPDALLAVEENFLKKVQYLLRGQGRAARAAAKARQRPTT